MKKNQKVRNRDTKRMPMAVTAGVYCKKREVKVDQAKQEEAAKLYEKGMGIREIGAKLGMQFWEVEYSIVDNTPRPQYKKAYICPGCRNLIEIDPCLICYVRRHQ